ncbi:4152_t:CDS:2 [Diversispora eburnea]|uniref:4152_t:CDS:1 n=1 Tax=Diversispora eburnea TaxID=1213867 RepID=A0A9N8YI39_9GLOM|nr:4152_t:CDS:2 [Diversispora eburnea]
MGLFYLLLIPVAIFGYYTLRGSNEKYHVAFQRFSKVFWVAILIIVLLTLIQLINSFLRRQDLIHECEDDYHNGVDNIFYIMTNSTDGLLVTETCQHAVNFSLILVLLDFIFLKLCLWVYFGIIVELHHKQEDSIDSDSVKFD